MLFDIYYRNKNKKKNKAKKLDALKFIKINEHHYEYNHAKGEISLINLENQTCTCSEIIDKGSCLHFIRVAILERFQLPGIVSIDKFSTRNRRKIKKKKNLEDKDSFSSSSSDSSNYTDSNCKTIN